MKKILIIGLFFIISYNCFGQSEKLKSGFDKSEYLELLKVSAVKVDTIYIPKLSAPERFTKVYKSKSVGLDNSWELWVSPDSVAVISVRGTSLKIESWMENFYSAMVPAKGKLMLSKDFTFEYCLGTHPKAAVHTGWLIGTAFLSKDILPRIDSCLNKGIKDFIIVGHSQGGAISYLLTSYFNDLKSKNIINSAITFKTYCSAAPKPGNLYYAYEYENMTKNGMAFNVVNSADWVPEGPFTIQSSLDYNDSNPYRYALDLLKELPLGKRFVLSYAYKSLDKTSRKAARKYKKYLGKMVGKKIKDFLPDYEIPEYYYSFNFARAGSFITLYADDEYYKLFPDIEGEIWTHHTFEAYEYLALKYKE